METACGASGIWEILPLHTSPSMEARQARHGFPRPWVSGEINRLFPLNRCVQGWCHHTHFIRGCPTLSTDTRTFKPQTWGEWASQVARVVKHPPASTEDLRDAGSIPESEWSPGGGHGNPLWYSCLENPMDREVWWATVHGVAKCQTRLKPLRMHSHRENEWYEPTVLTKEHPHGTRPSLRLLYNHRA